MKETIQQISNTNTINLKELKADKPLSYAYLCFKNCLNNSGMDLIFINQDKNRVYFKIRDNINKYTTYIMELNNKEILQMNVYSVAIIKENVWCKK